MQNEFKNRFDYDLSEEQFAFIDNSVGQMDEEDLDDVELDKFDEALDQILDFTENNDAIFCKDIKEEVMSLNDSLIIMM